MTTRLSRSLVSVFVLVALTWAIGVTVTLWQVRRVAAATEALLADYAHVRQDAITAIHGEAYYQELLAERDAAGRQP